MRKHLLIALSTAALTTTAAFGQTPETSLDKLGAFKTRLPRLFSVRVSRVSLPEMVVEPSRSVTPVPLIVPSFHVSALLTVMLPEPVIVLPSKVQLALLNVTLPVTDVRLTPTALPVGDAETLSRLEPEPQAPDHFRCRSATFPCTNSAVGSLEPRAS